MRINIANALFDKDDRHYIYAQLIYLNLKSILYAIALRSFRIYVLYKAQRLSRIDR